MEASKSGTALTHVRAIRVETGAPVQTWRRLALIDVHLAVPPMVAGVAAVASKIINAVRTNAAVQTRIGQTLVHVRLAVGAHEAGRTIALGHLFDQIHLAGAAVEALLHLAQALGAHVDVAEFAGEAGRAGARHVAEAVAVAGGSVLARHRVARIA